MMSSKWGYLCTHVIEKVERDKMSVNREVHSDEEERMVAMGEGRVRRLVQAVRRIQREREKAGQTLLNLQEAPNVHLRMWRQEVGLPHGWVETLDRRLGVLQAWGRRSHTNSALEPMTELHS